MSKRAALKRKTMGGNQYLLEKEREQQLENSCQYYDKLFIHFVW